MSDEKEELCEDGEPCEWVEDRDYFWGTTDYYCAKCFRLKDWSKVPNE